MQGYEFHYVYSRKITWTELLINYGTGKKKATKQPTALINIGTLVERTHLDYALECVLVLFKNFLKVC